SKLRINSIYKLTRHETDVGAWACPCPNRACAIMPREIFNLVVTNLNYRLSAIRAGTSRCPYICLITVLCGFLFSGCQQQMAKQPSYHPLDQTSFFENGMSSRPLVNGTVALGELREDSLLYTGV